MKCCNCSNVNPNWFWMEESVTYESLDENGNPLDSGELQEARRWHCKVCNYYTQKPNDFNIEPEERQ